MRRTIAFLALSLMPALAGADETGPGQALYLTHCAACHGREATGEGPMAGLLTVGVPDLTLLSAGNEGLFPVSRVVQTIDGRIALRGHGGPMLVYGQILGGGSAAVELPDGEVLQTRGDIVSIAGYLQSIQAE